MTSFENSPAVIIEKRTGNAESPFREMNESLVVNTDGKVILSEIPVEFDRMEVTGENVIWGEIDEDLPNESQYKVDYQNKIITFNISNKGKQLNFRYMGMGNHYYSAKSIYTAINNGKVTETLYDVIKAGETAIGNLNEINETIERAETAITNTETAISTINNAIKDVGTSVTNANTQATYAKTQGDYAKQQGDSAKLAITNATTKIAETETARQNAITATTNANTAITNTQTATTNANTATTNANNKAQFAETQGNRVNEITNNFKYIGDYNNTTQYLKYNLVRYNGSTYICIKDSKGNAVTNTTYWQLLAIKGNDGAGSVVSVNGKGGTVVLNSSDIGSIENGGNVPKFSAGSLSNRPTSTADGHIYICFDDNRIYRFSQTSTTWIMIGGAGNINWNDITGKPIIPTKTSQLTNDSGYITTSTAPVKSVNTKSGNVTLTASDVGASPTNHTHSELHTHSNKSVLDQITQTGLNQIDEYETKINNLTQSVTSNTNKIGNLTNLTTTEKSSLVGAINEINEKADNALPISRLTDVAKITRNNLLKNPTFNLGLQGWNNSTGNWSVVNYSPVGNTLVLSGDIPAGQWHIIDSDPIWITPNTTYTLSAFFHTFGLEKENTLQIEIFNYDTGVLLTSLTPNPQQSWHLAQKKTVIPSDCNRVKIRIFAGHTVGQPNAERQISQIKFEQGDYATAFTNELDFKSINNSSMGNLDIDDDPTDIAYYVRTNGNDSNDGKSEATAFKTFGKALTMWKRYTFGGKRTFNIGVGVDLSDVLTVNHREWKVSYKWGGNFVFDFNNAHELVMQFYDVKSDVRLQNFTRFNSAIFENNFIGEGCSFNKCGYIDIDTVKVDMSKKTPEGYTSPAYAFEFYNSRGRVGSANFTNVRNGIYATNYSSIFTYELSGTMFDSTSIPIKSTHGSLIDNLLFSITGSSAKYEVKYGGQVFGL